jgi:predicted PurR-regulated permease PerM
MQSQKNKELIEGALPLLILLVLFFIGFITLRPFLPAIVWGVVLSVSFRPMHDRFTHRLGGGRRLATLVVAILMLLILVLPIVGLSRALIAFLPDAIVWISSTGGLSFASPVTVQSTGVENSISAHWAALIADLQYLLDHFRNELRPIAFWLIGEGRLFGGFVVEFTLGVLLATILLHKARATGLAFERFVERVGGTFGREIVEKSILTIRTTVFGLLGSAAVQAVVASFAYWLAGAPHWPILAMLTFMLGLIQIGPVLIWLPLSIWLWSDGQIGMSVFVSLWGLIVVGLSDNVVKTLVVSKGSDIPAILAFLGAIGGLVTWGIVGLFLGPVIIAVCYQITLAWLHSDLARVEIYTDPDD